MKEDWIDESEDEEEAISLSLREKLKKSLDTWNRSNPEKAIHWFSKAAEQGFDDARFHLALCYLSGVGIFQDKVAAFHLFLQAAKNGHKRSQFYVSLCYRNGIGVQPDTKWYEFWDRKFSDDGPMNSNQQFLLAMYLLSIGNYSEAAYWMAKSAKNGNAAAQYELAVFYRDGTGMKQNQEQALKWFEEAAENGISVAQYELALYYLIGILVPKDEEKAISFLETAAKSGYPKAMKMLINRYQQRNEFEKAKYWRKMLAGDLKSVQEKSLTRFDTANAIDEKELWGEEYQEWKNDCITFMDKLPPP